MFSGIIRTIGTVKHLQQTDAGARVTLQAPAITRWQSQVGESIAVNGVCLTLTAVTSTTFTVDAMPETLRRTTLQQLDTGSRVNLEPALRLADRLDGHLVLGHVDGTAELLDRVPDGNAIRLRFGYPSRYRAEIVEKGSVTLDGVSLTVIQAMASTFDVAVIPHTQDQTTLGRLVAHDRVNLETDILGKYVKRLQEVRTDEQ